MLIKKVTSNILTIWSRQITLNQFRTMLRKEISVGVEIASNGFFVSAVQNSFPKKFFVPVEPNFFYPEGLPTDTRFLGSLLFSAFQKEFTNLSHLNIQVSLPSYLWEQISFVTHVCDASYLKQEMILEFQETQQLDIAHYLFQYDVIFCCDGKKCLILGRAIEKHYVKLFEDLFLDFKLKRQISLSSPGAALSSPGLTGGSRSLKNA